MTDSTGFSSNTLRRQRGRAPSGNVASSVRYDDSSLRVPRAQGQQQQQALPHSLRSTSSRYSLNEHFAATRSLYEFDFDDASSYMPDGASVMIRDEAGEVLSEAVGDDVAQALEELAGDYYDILCLPREDGQNLEAEDVRRAYHRLFLLFYPDAYPESLQPIARRQFLKAQEAFETLVDPARRASYDSDFASMTDGDLYEKTAMDELWRRLQHRTGLVSELGIRFDVSSSVKDGTDGGSRGVTGCRALDFNIGHSSTVALPNFLGHNSLLGSRPFSGRCRTSAPSLSIAGSVYGVVPPMSSTPLHIFASPNQPLHPATTPRHRLLQLVENKLSPVVSSHVRHEIINDHTSVSTDQTHMARWNRSEIEYGIDILPELTPSLRTWTHVSLPGAQETVIETSIKGRAWSRAAPPRLAVGVQHPTQLGTAFVRVDSGDWTLAPEAFRFLSGGPRSSHEVAYADFPLQIATSIELGVTTEACESDTSTGWNDDSQLRASTAHERCIETSRDRPSWSASATAFPMGHIGANVRYIVPLPQAASRLEIDLATSTFHPQQLSIRQLFSVTRTLQAGLELSVSRSSTHLSLHLSRLRQRISIPLLLPPLAHIRSSTLFLASVIPFVSVAVYKLISARRQSRDRRAGKGGASSTFKSSSAALQAAISLRREEADHLTGLLAQPVANRQKGHASRHGLVILSAKFGVVESTPSEENRGSGGAAAAGVGRTGSLTFHPDEEIADVTVALAALIDHQTGTLRIPSGVRKGRIPGFWDPVPEKEKLMLIRYSWKGQEAFAECRGNNELVLPPGS